MTEVRFLAIVDAVWAADLDPDELVQPEGGREGWIGFSTHDDDGVRRTANRTVIRVTDRDTAGTVVRRALNALGRRAA